MPKWVFFSFFLHGVGNILQFHAFSQPNKSDIKHYHEIGREREEDENNATTNRGSSSIGRIHRPGNRKRRTVIRKTRFVFIMWLRWRGLRDFLLIVFLLAAWRCIDQLIGYLFTSETWKSWKVSGCKIGRLENSEKSVADSFFPNVLRAEFVKRRRCRLLSSSSSFRYIGRLWTEEQQQQRIYQILLLHPSPFFHFLCPRRRRRFLLCPPGGGGMVNDISRGFTISIPIPQRRRGYCFLPRLARRRQDIPALI